MSIQCMLYYMCQTKQTLAEHQSGMRSFCVPASNLSCLLWVSCQAKKKKKYLKSRKKLLQWYICETLGPDRLVGTCKGTRMVGKREGLEGGLRWLRWSSPPHIFFSSINSIMRKLVEKARHDLMLHSIFSNNSRAVLGRENLTRGRVSWRKETCHQQHYQQVSDCPRQWGWDTRGACWDWSFCTCQKASENHISTKSPKRTELQSCRKWLGKETKRINWGWEYACP